MSLIFTCEALFVLSVSEREVLDILERLEVTLSFLRTEVVDVAVVVYDVVGVVVDVTLVPTWDVVMLVVVVVVVVVEVGPLFSLLL